MIKYRKDFSVEPRDFYVYTHHRMSDGKIFYVGKGKDKRYKDFNGRSKHWSSMARKYGVIVKISQEGLREFYSFEVESNLICKYGRLDKSTGCLVNHSDGGCTGITGRKPTPDEITRSVLNRKQAVELKPAKKKVLNTTVHNHYDGKEYCFVNKITGCTIICTRRYFQKLKSVNVESLFGRKRKSITTKEWAVLPDGENIEPFLKRIRNTRGSIDINRYLFAHTNGEVFKGTRKEFQSSFKIMISHINALFSKKKPAKTIKGWSLLKETNGN